MIVFIIWPSPFSPSFLAMSIFRHWLFISFWSFYSVNSECIQSNWALDFKPITECWNPCSRYLSGQFSMGGREVAGFWPFIDWPQTKPNRFGLLEGLSPGQPSLPLAGEQCWPWCVYWKSVLKTYNCLLKVVSIGDHVSLGGTKTISG